MARPRIAAARDWVIARWRLDELEPALARRIRVLTVVTLGVALLGFPFVGQYLMLGVPLMSVAVGMTMLAATINLVVLHRSHNARRGGIVVACLLLALLTLSNWVSGGFYDPNFGWLYTLPIAAALLVDARAGWFFTALVLLLALGFWLAPSLGVEVPNLIPPEQHAAQSLANRLSAIVAIGIMLAAIDSAQRFGERLLNEAHAQTQAEMQRRVAMQVQLAESDRMASMGRLSAGLAHEINNPLSFIMGNLELVELSLGDLEREADLPANETLDETRELIGDALTGAQRIAELVKALRDFAVARDDEAVVIEIDAALDWALKLLASDLRQRAQLVEERTLGLRVLGQQGRLAQVFVNIIKNACQAIPPGQARTNTIMVRTRAEAGQAVIEIADTGVGMDEDTQARLFEPFYSTKSQGEGMGLGMSICHGIVRSLDGQLEVDSTLGEGSTFTLTLPLASEVERDEADAVEVPLPRLRIVAIDDEPLILRTLEGLLGAHELRTHCDPRVALSELEEADVDVVLCDVMMPELDGVQVHAALSKRCPELARRMVFVTGGVLDPEVQARMAATGVPVLEKPVEGARLRRTLAEVLEQLEA